MNKGRFAREYFWFALALIAVLLGSAARAAAAEEPVPGKKKPTVEELEQRIAILEQALRAQQRALESLQASQPAAASPSAVAAAAAAGQPPAGQPQAGHPPVAQAGPPP